jgi:two-component system, OmpR family, response regulator ArlR
MLIFKNSPQDRRGYFVIGFFVKLEPFFHQKGTNFHQYKDFRNLKLYICLLEWGYFCPLMGVTFVPFGIQGHGMEKVLAFITEKDQDLVSGAVTALIAAGYDVVEAFDAADGIKKIIELNPDVVLAGTELPPVNGEDAYHWIHQANSRSVIILGEREELVATLESGADAYIIKPFSGREVVARVHSLLRRKVKDHALLVQPRLNIEGYLSNTETWPKGLSRTELRISTCLLFNQGKIIDYPQLISEIWGTKKVSVDTLHFYIRRLRHKLVNFNVFNRRGVGYGLSGNNQPPS